MRLFLHRGLFVNLNGLADKLNETENIWLWERISLSNSGLRNIIQYMHAFSINHQISYILRDGVGHSLGAEKSDSLPTQWGRLDYQSCGIKVQLTCWSRQLYRVDRSNWRFAPTTSNRLCATSAQLTMSLIGINRYDSPYEVISSHTWWVLAYFKLVVARLMPEGSSLYYQRILTFEEW